MQYQPSIEEVYDFIMKAFPAVIEKVIKLTERLNALDEKLKSLEPKLVEAHASATTLRRSRAKPTYADWVQIMGLLQEGKRTSDVAKLTAIPASTVAKIAKWTSEEVNAKREEAGVAATNVEAAPQTDGAPIEKPKAYDSWISLVPGQESFSTTEDELPVPAGAYVTVRFANGAESTGLADEYEWYIKTGPMQILAWRWPTTEEYERIDVGEV